MTLISLFGAYLTLLTWHNKLWIMETWVGESGLGGGERKEMMQWVSSRFTLIVIKIEVLNYWGGVCMCMHEHAVSDGLRSLS